MSIKWASLLGRFKQKGTTLIFQGGSELDIEGQPKTEIGNFLCNRKFSSGNIIADIEFTTVDQYTACDIILFYNPATRYFVTAGLGAQAMYTIRDFTWICSRSGKADYLNCRESHGFTLRCVTFSGAVL